MIQKALGNLLVSYKFKDKIMNESLLKRILKAVFSRGLGAILGLSVTFFLPQILPLNDVGSVYFLLSQAMLITVFIKFGLDYSLNEKLLVPSSKKAIINNINIDLYSMVILWVFITIVYTVLFYLFDLDKLGFIAILWGGILSFNFYLFQYFKFEGRVFRASVSRNVINIFSLFIILLLGSLLNFNFNDIIYNHLLLLFILTLFNLYSFISFDSMTLRSFSNVKKNILKSRVFFYYSILLFLLSDIDIWFIKMYLTNEDLAVYATIKRFSLVIAIVIDLANLIIPNFYKQAINDAVKAKAIFLMSRKISLYGVVFSIVILVLLFILQKNIFELIFGIDKDVPNFILLGFLVSFIFNLLFGFNEVYLTIVGEKNILFKKLIITVALLIILNSFLIYFFGLNGAVLSFIISNFHYRYSLYRYVKKNYNVSLLAGIK